MRPSRSCRHLVAALTTFSVSLGAVFVQNLKQAPAAADAAAQTPQQLYQEKCSACHNAPDPNAEAKTTQRWQATVNRMLYQHGAKDSISPDQAQTILVYLDTFAARGPVQGGRGRFGFGRGRIDGSDVWASDPSYSRVYNFTNHDAAAGFQAKSGRWSVRPIGASGSQLIFASMPHSTAPALMIAPTPGARGDMQIESDFRSGAPLPGKPLEPVVFGLAFGVADNRTYNLARYDDAKKELSLIQVQSGVETPIKSVPIESGLAATPDGWHKLRVSVIGSRVKVWLDYDKKIDTNLPQPPANNSAGLWTSTRAAARTFIVDVYPPA